MEKDIFLKIRSWLIFSVMVIGYPAALIITTIWQIISSILYRNKLKNISGDIALVTGGGQGLGRCIAIELAKRGCHIAIADVNIEGAEETARILNENYNVKAKAYKVDVSNYEEVKTLNEKITEDLGAATILINNAGILVLSNFLEPDWRDVQQMINVNLAAHFWTNQIFLSNMKAKQKGHIVAVCSAAGMLPIAFSPAYTSTKYAVRGMMRSLRIELMARRLVTGDEIYATTVLPTFLQTNNKVVDIVKKTKSDILYPLIPGEEIAKRTVLGMLRNEEEIVAPAMIGVLHKLYETLPAFCQDFLLVGPAYMTVKTSKKVQRS